MKRQGAQVAIGGKPRRVDTDFGRVERRPGPIGRTTEDTRDLVWPFLRLERAGAVDEGAARLDELRRVIEQPRLDLGETAEVVGSLQPQDVGMAAHRARGKTGRVEKHAVEPAA